MYVNVMNVSSYRKLYFVHGMETGTVKGNKLCEIFTKLRVVRIFIRKHKVVHSLTVSYSTNVHLNENRNLNTTIFRSN